MLIKKESVDPKEMEREEVGVGDVGGLEGEEELSFPDSKLLRSFKAAEADPVLILSVLVVVGVLFEEALELNIWVLFKREKVRGMATKARTKPPIATFCFVLKYSHISVSIISPMYLSTNILGIIKNDAKYLD